MPIKQERTMIESEAVTAGAVRQSVGAGLNALAAECHRLAVARGKYPQGWTPGPWWLDGWDIRSEDGEVYDDDEDGGAIGGK